LVRFEWHGDGPGSGTGPPSYTLHPSPPNHRSVQQGHEFTLIPADYYGHDPTTVRDAVRAFTDDLLAPLFTEYKTPAGSTISPSEILSSLQTRLPNNLAPDLPAAQQFLACVRRALIGNRGPNAFRQAAQLWHRRAAAVAALRNENQTNRPGWPPLCPPWTSRCGAFEIVPLTTAKALVEEGNAHHHCVGTYYDACRSGTTQILSLRSRGKPMVTAEILMDPRIAALRVGQFKGLFDEVPGDPAVHQAVREFLHDLRSGIHPLNRNCAHTVNGLTSIFTAGPARPRRRSRMRAKPSLSISPCCRAAPPPTSISGATAPASEPGSAPR
jgi:PcfJ-like protein